ncbi:kinetochore protein SPC24 homolog [Andrographis paniculata]|uniref:kinetochore protein SPC24 homolog n=1 Tax=Andrographis paniculata TaxID=175694 RepID=UPI0021E6EE3F|nr:kinetochore protein SPC24 homolog [Andrographis paniculata]XP_051130389.1 kinetochore protein SPC24 homolog [Andrographis paniculata]
MDEKLRRMDMGELMSYGDNLIEILKEDKDAVSLKHFLRQSEALQSQCIKDYDEVHNSIEDYEKRIEACKQKAAAAESESAADTELDTLQKQLEEEQKLEWMLKEELREIIREIDDLEQQRVAAEEQIQSMKKFERDEKRAQMKLSMYASVTNIIPNLDDQSTISGHIVDRNKKVVERFEFDPSKSTPFDTCNNIWKMINL